MGSSLLGGGVAKVSQASKKLAGDLEQTNQASKKLEANLQKQEETVSQLNELYRVQPFLVGQTSDKIKQSNEALAKAKANLSSNKSEIKRLEARLRGLKPAAEKYTNEVKEGTRELRRANDRAKALKTTLNGIKKTGGFLGGKGSGLRGALVAGGGGLAARSAFNAASLKESTQARVGVLENEFKQLIGLNEKAKESADKFLLSQTQVLQDYINLGNRLGEQGASLQDLQNIYEGLNTVLVKNRATTQEAASATLQLSQALGAGKLQGEEFRAINEAAPQVITEVSKVLKVPRGEVKKLAADGKVSSDVLLQALTNLRKNGADQLQGGFVGAFKATREFDKALTEFSETVGEELLPVITPLLEGASAILKEFGSWDKETRQLAVNSLLLGAALLVVAGPLTALVKGTGVLLIGLGKLTPLILGTAAATGKLALALAGLKIALLALPFVAIGGALVALALDMRRVNKETELLNKRLKSDDLQDVRVATEELTAKKKELQKQLESLQGSAFYKGITDDINSLKGQIKEVDGLIDEAARRRKLIIEVELLNKGVKKIEGFDTLTDAQIQEAFKIAGVDPDGVRSSATSSSGSGSQRKSRVPELKRQKELDLELTSLNKQQLDAQLAENSALIETLEKKKLVLQADKDIADIKASEVPNNEKLLEIDIRRAQLQQELDRLGNDKAQRLKDEKQAIEDALEPLEKQRRLLDAQLAGRGEEETILQEIETIMKGLPKEERERVEALVRGNKAREKELEQAQKLKEFYGQVVQRVGTALEDALVTTLDVAINKTKDLGEALQEIASTLLKDVGRMFLNAGISGLQGKLFPNLFPMAEGGYVTGPTPALVGEGGESEYVIPASKMSGAMARYASGTRGEGVIDGPTPSRGGMAVAEAPMSINISGGITQIGGEDFVRKDQLPAIVAQASKAGEARTMRRLQMNPGARRKIGI